MPPDWEGRNRTLKHLIQSQVALPICVLPNVIQFINSQVALIPQPLLPQEKGSRLAKSLARWKRNLGRGIWGNQWEVTESNRLLTVFSGT